jgi:hypothetical protein
MRQVADHVGDDFVRGIETERRQIADVQLDDAMAFFLEALRFFEHGTADVVTDIQQLVRFQDGFHGGRFRNAVEAELCVTPTSGANSRAAGLPRGRCRHAVTGQPDDGQTEIKRYNLPIPAGFRNAP